MGRPAQDETPKLEWAMGLFGLALVAGVIGFITYRAVQDQTPYPDLRFDVAAVHERRGGYIVVLRVVNRGGVTAQGARIVGRLRGPDGTETSEINIDYVPAGSSRRAGLFFRNDPTQYRLDVSAEGYQSP